MSFWNNPLMNVIESGLLRLTNYIWKKRHPINRGSMGGKKDYNKRTAKIK